LVAGYYVIETWGVNATVVLGGAIEITAGLAGLLLARAAPPVTDEPPPPTESSAPAQGTRVAVLAATAVAGFAALAAEVLWTRVLGFAIDSTVYAFAMMLAVYLAGLAAGSLVLGALVVRGNRPVIAMGVIQAASGLAIVASVSTLARWASVGGRLA